MRLHTVMDGKAVSLPAAECFDWTADIAIVGMGTAGAMAVLQASREGFSVLGIERSTGMGGQGGMGCVWDYYYGCGGGLQEEVSKACEARLSKGAYVSSQRDGLKEQSFPGPVKSAVLEEMALSAGARLLYDTGVTGVYREGNRVVGLRVAQGETTVRVRTRMVIDGTGEAEVARLAGCRMLPPRLADGTHQYVSKAKSVLLDGRFVLGSWSVCGRVDLGNASAVTQSLLRAMTDPFERSNRNDERRAVYESPILGVREGRRIDSAENLILAEVLDGHETSEPIFYASSHVDSFNRDLALEDECLQDYQGICELRHAIISVGVPMGALIPKDMDGLLAAGRCIGVDHNIAACVRMKRDMEKTGETAAILAAESLRMDVCARQVPYGRVRARLEHSGCLSEKHRHPWLRGTRWTDPDHDRRPYRWPQSEADLKDILASDCPDTGLWVCRQQPGPWEPSLLQWLEDGNTALRRRSALALGMARHSAALPMLRRMASEIPDAPSDCGDAWKALCLLTRYACLEDKALYHAVLKRPRPQPGTTREQTLRADSWTYEFLQAEMGLLRLIESRPKDCVSEKEALTRIVHAPDFALPLTAGRMNLATTARNLMSPF